MTRLRGPPLYMLYACGCERTAPDADCCTGSPLPTLPRHPRGGGGGGGWEHTRGPAGKGLTARVICLDFVTRCPSPGCLAVSGYLPRCALRRCSEHPLSL
eukprot:TRINITY_DN3608_c0_g1_i1.p4 TRINITY_DN3608_c0_g1~~TRINITY_DN3608_c0_g1_i1.p4  ORF type:complete len:100 (-),score=2.00 TRINITY_DN3608_c0_g1_i1:9-308(-)